MSRSRIYAVACALLFLCCALISRPYAEMGVADDWSYVRTAQILANSGHIVYNGWATAMVGWQLYFAAALMKLFGPTFASARASTLIVGAANAVLMHRVFVRSGISDRNAVLATLAIALSPLYMLLSVTFMTDIQGLFGIVICLYCCIRAVQSAAVRSAVLWLCLAGGLNIVIGTSRQIAWLGVLVVVPSAAWLLRARRGLLLTGLFVTLAGGASVVWSMHWFQQQPYSLPEGGLLTITTLHQVLYASRQLLRGALEVPFLALAVLIAFYTEFRRSRWLPILSAATLIVFLGLTIVASRHHGADVLLEPLLSDWISPQGFYDIQLNGMSPIVLTTGVRAILTGLTIVGILCVSALLYRVTRSFRSATTAQTPGALTWGQLGVLVAPFTLAYFTLLAPRATGNLRDRYLLAFFFVAVLVLVRLYQQFVQERLPAAATIAVVATAMFSIAATHDMFAFDRARMAMAAEMAAVGVPDNHLDIGFEYNGWTELERGGHINDPRLVNPPHSFVPVDKFRSMSCDTKKEADPGLLHFAPEYGLAWRADACQGSTPFAPVTYWRWLALRPATIYAVRYGNFN